MESFAASSVFQGSSPGAGFESDFNVDLQNVPGEVLLELDAVTGMYRPTEKMSRNERVIRRDRVGLRARLFSIESDSAFVARVRLALGSIPFLGNRRNGAWYARDYAGTSYFKSTDGHQNQCRFSMARANLDVAAQVVKAGGAVIVDSTRRGKRFPDSFSRTVPIWCAVLNGIAFGTVCLHLPPWIPQIERRRLLEVVRKWIDTVQETAPDVAEIIRSYVALPLHPVWLSPCVASFQNPRNASLRVNQAIDATDECTDQEPYEFEVDLDDAEAAADLLLRQMRAPGSVPVFLLSASISGMSDEEHRMFHSWSYVQGAADDEEAWARDITPSQFWEHVIPLLQCQDYAVRDNAACAQLLDSIADIGAASMGADSFCSIGNTGIVICSRSRAEGKASSSSAVINLDERAIECALSHLHVPIQNKKGKKDSSTWQKVLLPSALRFYYEFCVVQKNPCLITCSNGAMASIIVALSILFVFFNDTFTQRRDPFLKRVVTKAKVQAAIMMLKVYAPGATPPRRMVKELLKFFREPFRLCLPDGDQ